MTVTAMNYWLCIRRKGKMPFIRSGNADVYYEDYGKGEAIIAIHGLIENTRYFTLTGVCDTLAKQYRVIPMDMRAHGKTRVDGEPWGYDDETVGRDLEALADYLELDRFHVLCHSTGGFAASRYAMEHSDRLLSLILTGTKSATDFFRVREESEVFHDRLASNFENYEWDKIIAAIKLQPFPFFTGIAGREDKDTLYDLAYEMMKQNDRQAVATFVRSFYNDPDPRVEGLRKISCPTLVIVGEKDDLFMESSKLFEREIPQCKLITYPDTGHMIAIERPQEMCKDILEFLRVIPRSV